RQVRTTDRRRARWHPPAPPGAIGIEAEQMNARMAPVSLFGFGSNPPGVGASRTLARHRRAMPWRRVWPSLGAVLAIALLAYGFDADAQEPQAAQHIVLDSSGVPTSANWVVLDARGIAAWRAEGDTRWHSFTRGEVLPPGTEIETGADGEITLVAGGDQLTIAPQGRLIV